MLAINFETTVIASEGSLTDANKIIKIDTARISKRRRSEDEKLAGFENARKKRRKKTDDGLQQYNRSPLTQADVDEGDLKALQPFIATLSEAGQITLFQACIEAMRLSTCKQVWDALYPEKKRQLEDSVKSWLTDLSEEDYQAFTARAQKNPLHAASADDDIDEIKEAALKLYRQQPAENSQLIKAIEDARQAKAQTEAQQILSGLPGPVRAALEMQLLNGLLSQGLPALPTFLPALPVASETTQS